MFLLSAFITLVIIISLVYSYGKRTVYEKELPYWGYPVISSDRKSYEIEIKGRKYKYSNFLMRNTGAIKGNSEHLIIAGGSNVFGQNLGEGETLANILHQSKKFQKYQIELFSFLGWGPNNILAFMERNPLDYSIGPKRGVMLYYFILDHINRACGSDPYLEWNRGKSPRYSVKGGIASYDGIFRDSLSYRFFLIRRGFFKLQRKLGLAKRPDKVEFSVQSEEDCIKLFSKIVSGIRREYHKVFPEGSFAAVIMAIDDFEKYSDVVTKVAKALQAEKILYYDFHKDMEVILRNRSLRKADILFPDIHVNKLYNELSVPFIQEIMDNLKKQNVTKP